MGILYHHTSSKSWQTLAVATVLSFGTGVTLGWFMASGDTAAGPAPAGEQAHAAAAAPSTAGTALGTGSRHAAGMQTAPVATPREASLPSHSALPPSTPEGWQALQAMNPDELTRRVQGDAKFAAAMAEQIMRGGKADPELRQFLAMTLAQAQPALLERSAEVLLRNSDVHARQQAFDLLSSLPDPPKAVAAAARQALLTEGNPQALAHALEALRASGGLASMRTDEAMVQQLRQYASSTDPQLRRESVAALIQADRTGAVEPVLRQALADTDPSVQVAAIGAAIDAGIRSPETKSQLLGLCFDPQADPLVRAEAISALQSFRLSNEEAARLAPVEQQLAAAQ